MAQKTITGEQLESERDSTIAFRFLEAFIQPDGTNHPPITSSITGIPANDAGSDGMMESGTISANTSQPDRKALPDGIKTRSALPSDLIISTIYAAADGRTESATNFLNWSSVFQTACRCRIATRGRTNLPPATASTTRISAIHEGLGRMAEFGSIFNRFLRAWSGRGWSRH